MNKLKEYFKSYYVLNDVSGLLFWDNATNLPKKSIESRSEQMSILSNFTDSIFRSEDMQEEIHTIDLIPIKRNELIKITITIDSIKNQLSEILIYNKNGLIQSFIIKSIKTNKLIMPFIFNIEDFPDIEVIDLR